MESKRLKAPEKAKVRKALEVLGTTEDLSQIRHPDLIKRVTGIVGFAVSISSIKTLANAEDITLWARTKPVDVDALSARMDDLRTLCAAQADRLGVVEAAVRDLKVTRVTLCNHSDRQDRAMGILIDELCRIESDGTALFVTEELRALQADRAAGLNGLMLETSPPEGSQGSAAL